MRQEVTRAHKGWALDSVTLHNDVTKSFKEEITAQPQVMYVFFKMHLIRGHSMMLKQCFRCQGLEFSKALL